MFSIVRQGNAIRRLCPERKIAQLHSWLSGLGSPYRRRPQTDDLRFTLQHRLLAMSPGLLLQTEALNIVLGVHGYCLYRSRSPRQAYIGSNATCVYWQMRLRCNI